MKIHCRQIPEGGTLHVEGEENAMALGLEEAGGEAVSPLSYSLDVGLSDGGLFATGWVAVRVRFRCVACLQDFEQEVRVDPFALQIELGGNELIDLTPVIREDIHLVLPPHPRCDAGGGTKCPAVPEGAPRAELRGQPATASMAWAALDQLKSPKK